MDNNIMDFRTMTSYQDKVLDILESWFHYDELIMGYDIEGPARSIFQTVKVCYYMGLSPMKCAIIIWSLTMNYQIIPDTQAAIKH